MSPIFTANFAQQLIRAKGIGNGKPNFSVVLASAKNDPFWKILKGQLEAAQKEKFGKVFPASKLRHYPIKDSDDVDWLDDGQFYFAPKRSEDDGPPEIVDRDLQEIISPREIYSGMKCRVTYRCAAYDNDFGKGVSVYLDNVQKTGDGEPIGRVTPKAIDDFAAGLDADGGSDTTEDAGDDLLG